jgi:hypothetical protein
MLHVSDKPVFRPLAESTDRIEWLNERLPCLQATIGSCSVTITEFR